MWFELKRRIEDFLRAQHVLSLPQAIHTDRQLTLTTSPGRPRTLPGPLRRRASDDRM
jgi:hypothetical protein